MYFMFLTDVCHLLHLILIDIYFIGHLKDFTFQQRQFEIIRLVVSNWNTVTCILKNAGLSEHMWTVGIFHYILLLYIQVSTGGPLLVRFHLIQSPVQYDLKLYKIVQNPRIIVRFFAFFSQKTAFLKVHFMYLVLVLAQYDFSIVRFPGSPKFVLSGDPLYCRET